MRRAHNTQDFSYIIDQSILIPILRTFPSQRETLLDENIYICRAVEYSKCPLFQNLSPDLGMCCPPSFWLMSRVSWRWFHMHRHSPGPPVYEVLSPPPVCTCTGCFGPPGTQSGIGEREESRAPPDTSGRTLLDC